MPLITVGHSSYDEEFCRCYRFCRERRLFAFGQVAEVRQPPMPVDDKFGPAPIADRLKEIAAETADFERRIQEGRKIEAELSVRESRRETREYAQDEAIGRDEILARIAEETPSRKHVELKRSEFKMLI